VLYSYAFNGTTATYGSTTPLTPNISATNQNAAASISRDGTVVYGWAQTPGNTLTKWTSGTGLVNLGRAGGGTDSATIPSHRGVSSDGSVVVGTTTLVDGVTTKAFTYNGTFTTIGALSGGTNSQSLAVSANGSIVFGTSESTLHPNGEAFFWTAGGGFTALGTPNDAWIPNVLGGITADGSVGIVDFENGNTPNTYLFNSHGMFSLSSVLTAAGIDFSAWSNLGGQGISPDGQLIFGQGLHGGSIEGFVAQIPSGLVSAIPEPATYGVICGVAVLGLTLVKRHRRSSLADSQVARLAEGRRVRQRGDD
jgi:probable HAF family extracellular repeat protein